jgi:hypothetical protein
MGDQFPASCPACIHLRQDFEASVSKIVTVSPRLAAAEAKGAAERALARSALPVHHQHNPYSVTHTTFLTSHIDDPISLNADR